MTRLLSALRKSGRPPGPEIEIDVPKQIGRRATRLRRRFMSWFLGGGSVPKKDNPGPSSCLVRSFAWAGPAAQRLLRMYVCTFSLMTLERDCHRGIADCLTTRRCSSPLATNQPQAQKQEPCETFAWFALPIDSLPFPSEQPIVRTPGPLICTVSLRDGLACLFYCCCVLAQPSQHRFLCFLPDLIACINIYSRQPFHPSTRNHQPIPIQCASVRGPSSHLGRPLTSALATACQRTTPPPKKKTR